MNDAETSTRARNCVTTLKDFGRVVLTSKAVMCRSLSIVSRLVSSDTTLYANYYKEIDSEVRIPEDNRFDRGRSAVDGTLFPNYQKEICFAALSLDDIGTSGFGAYNVVLKEKMIARRASVFEENSFTFCQIKHRIVVGDPIPPGYRATWQERDLLAMAKLHSAVGSTTLEGDYPRILLNHAASPTDDDFVEVHIWGPIHRTAIERVVGPKPRNREDKVLWASLDRKLKEVGATLETR